MSSVSRASGARCCVLLVVALVACSGSGSGDLFAPSGTGPCAKCGSSGAAGSGGEGSTTSSTSTTGGSAGTGSATTTSAGSGGGGAGGASATTGGGAGTTGGSSTAGTGGTSGGSAGVEDSGVNPTDDAQSIDVVVAIDSGRADRAVDAVADHVTCVPTGMEICDGLDNNCNGGIDENDVCRNECIGVSFNGVGYMFCHGVQDRTWTEARTDCVNHGMHLIRVDNAEQNTFIRNTGISVGYSDPIWIGASDLAREGTWVWTDGTEFWLGGVNGHTVNGHFAAWDVDQPNSAEGPEDCATVFTNIETWHDVNCGIRHAYMCQALAPIR